MKRTWIAPLVALALGGCGLTQVGEIEKTQKEIVARLDAQDKMLKDILARVSAGRPAPPDPNQVFDLPVAHSPVKGSKTAKVTLVEFSDFQCPFCAQASADMEKLVDAFPKDLKFVYKQMPLTQIHKQAMPAAKASVAAGNQGKFWEMHDKLFENYKALSDENIKKFAKELGLDMKEFEADMTSKETEKLVVADMELAAKSGVRGTPSFFLNGKRVANRSFEALKAQIEDELKKPPAKEKK